MSVTDCVRLHRLPLGAGGPVVRFSGRAYESVTARHRRRPPGPLFHSALEVSLAGECSVIEMAPV